jgi:hypothetical protein
VGIEDFRWHDLRHTWASWHIQNGTPIHVLQELGGWSDIRMVQRYAHLAPEHLACYADNISGLKGVNGTLIGYTWENNSLGVTLKNPCKSLTYKGFKMARLERLRDASLRRGLRPRFARAKSLTAILSNSWSFAPESYLSPYTPSIKKPRFAGLFYGWRAWRDSNSRPLGS